jgi:cytosine/adenosine deaminase-related metal-dependent hydrolase
MKYAVSGRVVTMNDAFDIVSKGVLYIDGNIIADVRASGEPAPDGFSDVPVADAGGTIFPGLIELHNHLAYNALPLWDVDKKYGNRDQWSGTEAYRASVTGPMKILGSSPDLLPALIRYVECKCLLGGVTTSQGIALFSNQGVRRFYKGLVRNVEQTTDHDLPEANARIADVEKSDAKAFLARLKKSTCMLLHLSEGVDAAALAHFQALNLGSEWAIAPSLSGIHSVALARAELDVLASHGASMVWSPLSNLLLYGQTADVTAARAAGLRMGLGADWSYTGSKNLLGELKIARVAGAGQIPDRDIVAMATREAARILEWSHALGSLEKGKRADFIVVDGSTKDAYAELIDATEANVRLVVIDGAPRAGMSPLMQKLGAKGEVIKVGGEHRTIVLRDPASDPAVLALALGQAMEVLDDALRRLPELAKKLENPTPPPPSHALHEGPPLWFLALDELGETGADVRHRLPMQSGELSGASRAASASKPLSEIVKAFPLDVITAVDDHTYRKRLVAQKNLPDEIREALGGNP